MTQPPSEQPIRRPSAEETASGMQDESQPADSANAATGERKDPSDDGAPSQPSIAGAIGVAGDSASTTQLDFTEIVPRYECALLRYVGQLLRPSDPDVEDIVQDAFLRLHRYVGERGHDSVRNIQTWLYKVAHNLTMDTLRKRKVRKDGQQRIVQDAVESGSVDGLQPPPTREYDPSSTSEGVGGVDALGQLEHREACQHALAELQQLPEHQKEAVLLKMIQGLTIRQISEITGVSIGNVGYRINQGLAELSRRLKTAGVI